MVRPTFSEIKGITKISQRQEFYDILKMKTRAARTSAPALYHLPN